MALPRNGGGEPPRYRPTLLDRLGPDGINRVKVLPAAGACAIIAMFAGAYAAARQGWPVAVIIPVVLLLALAVGALAWLTVIKLVDAAGAGFGAFIAPSGGSTPGAPDYSYQDALVMQGDVAGAVESYESIIAATPGIVDARIRAADLYAGAGRNPQRAADLFREVQRIPNVLPTADLYASNRLVDLYSGPLRQPGRAIVELRRIEKRYPRSAAAAHAPRAIAALKARSTARDDSGS
ncbi:MAG: tetratricopeptide repeat protein [Gemmatimonadota bacterium]|nr:tetratricopeptide repeat protein [Gemmatimonadota bacterium]